MQSEVLLDLSYYQNHSTAKNIPSDNLFSGKGSSHLLGLSCQGFLHLRKDMCLCLHIKPLIWKPAQKILFYKKAFYNSCTENISDHLQSQPKPQKVSAKQQRKLLR